MNCKEAGRMLSAYLDEELTVEKYRSLKRHLMSCSICQEELEKLRVIKNLMRDLDSDSNFNWNFKVDWEAAGRQARAMRRREMAFFSLAAVLVIIALFFVFSQEQAQWEIEVMHPEVLVDLHQSLSGNQLDIPLKQETNFIGTLELVSGGR
ncbi:MAG TPA: zf-HC2 domain-containing protein [Candidatus Atribacteria bacterium]|nr:zf-HC2 domain-containing protein [Candidatus Atribacteria bacterium]